MVVGKMILVFVIYRLPPLPPTSPAINDWRTRSWRLRGHSAKVSYIALQDLLPCRCSKPVKRVTILYCRNIRVRYRYDFGMRTGPVNRFRWPTRKAFVLRTDAAFAAPGLPNLCWCRNVVSRASKRRAGAAFGARGVWGPFL